MPKNIDPSEIEKFSALAKNWWDENGPMKPLHELNPLRLQYIQRYTELENKKVLDIGCGAGILTESLAKAGAIATGIDMSAEAISVAQEHAKQHSLTIDYQTIQTEIFATTHAHTFDVISCMEMLEHVPDPLAIIKATRQLIKPDGVIFFSTINRNPKSFLSAIVGAEYILNLLPKGTHQYQQFIKPSELTKWCESAGLTLKHLQGMTYHPLQKVFSFTQSVAVNYLACFKVADN